jgi:hypothetical protein
VHGRFLDLVSEYRAERVAGGAGATPRPARQEVIS